MQQINYNEISKIYDEVRESDVELINQFLKELPARGPLSILDIGCGTGNYTDQFQRITQERDHRFYGIDRSDGMLSRARQKNRFVVYQVGEAEKIPFQANFFDFVYMTDVIHHVPDINRMFAEIHRVLQSGGKACIVTQSHKQIAQRPVAQFFPGTVAVDQGRYPAIQVIIKAAEHNCLNYLRKRSLFEGEEVELGVQFLELVQKKGYSMLHLLPEREYRTGLRALETELRNGPVTAQSAGETLIWFTKV